MKSTACAPPGTIAATILQALAKAVEPGRTTGEIDRLAAELMRRTRVPSAFLGYRGFPGYICISVNEEVVHGIGGPRRIQPGDIVKIDVGIIKSGFIGDNATTVAAGDIPLETKRLLAATEQSLFEAIEPRPRRPQTRRPLRLGRGLRRPARLHRGARIRRPRRRPPPARGTAGAELSAARANPRP